MSTKSGDAACKAVSDPLVVHLPDVLGQIAHDPELIGRNAVRLAETVRKYEDGMTVAASGGDDAPDR